MTQKQKMCNTDPTKTQERTQASGKGKQLCLPHYSRH